jgi:hypothetical protein
MRPWSAARTAFGTALLGALWTLPGVAWADDLDHDGVDDAQDLCIGDDASGDADGDGWCAASVDGTVADCDDTAPARFPDAEEACDGLDDDCDGRPAADELDADADGVPLCAGDCDDFDDAALPGGTEVCDGADNDCDGAVDATGDGVVCDAEADDEDDAAPEGCYCGTSATGGAWLAAGALLAALGRRR